MGYLISSDSRLQLPSAKCQRGLRRTKETLAGQRLLSICTCFQVGAGLPLRCTSNGCVFLPGNESFLHPAYRGLLSDHGGAFRCFNNLSYPCLGSYGLEELLGGSPSLQTQLTVRRPAPSDSPTVQEGGVFDRPANLAFKAPAAQPTHKTLWHLLSLRSLFTF